MEKNILQKCKNSNSFLLNIEKAYDKMSFGETDFI